MDAEVPPASFASALCSVSPEDELEEAAVNKLFIHLFGEVLEKTAFPSLKNRVIKPEEAEAVQE